MKNTLIPLEVDRWMLITMNWHPWNLCALLCLLLFMNIIILSLFFYLHINHTIIITISAISFNNKVTDLKEVRFVAFAG